MKQLRLEYEDTEAGHHALGFQIGQHCREMYAQALGLDQTIQKLLECLRVDQGFAEQVGRFDQYLAGHVPRIREEMRGLSEGANVDYAVVLVSVYRKELGCTDVVINGSEFRGWGHNEDYSWSEDFRPLLLVEAVRKTDKFRWMSVVYPFCLAGMTFGVNTAGVAFSVDNLTPKIPRPAGLASNVVCRLALESGSLSGFLRTVTDERLVTGRGFAFADWRDPEKLHYVETGPGGVHKVVDINGIYAHANHYIELEMEQEIGLSSERRMQRLKECASETRNTREDLLEILSDEKFQDYPIFRTGRNPDKGFTEFSAVFDLDRKCVEIFTCKPGTSAPWRTMRFEDPRWVPV